MKANDLKKFKLPDAPGVYFFKRGKEILYIGKATSLKDRVRSYLGKDLIATRGPLLVEMVFRANSVAYEKTDSVLEALILESNLIKKHQPYYNTKEKDDKSFNYVCITKDAKVAIVRGRILFSKNQKFSALRPSLGAKGNKVGPSGQKTFGSLKSVYGPFTNGGQLREAMKIIRKLFPYIEERKGIKGKEEFYKQIKLLPESSEENKKNIKNIKLLFEGKKKRIISELKKDMNTLAKKQKFEEAGAVKRQIFALEHINDISLIKNSLQPKTYNLKPGFRIEAYDVAHLSGQNMVGVMVVVENGEPEKSEYKKFKIRTQQDANDTGALAEILERRFNHPEWGTPSLIVLDGSTAQINVAKKILKDLGLKIDIAAVVKDDKHKAREIKYIGKEDLAKYKKDILLANAEAHRFAIKYHKDMRRKNFLKLRK